ncbi:MAG: exosortase/archaeosortase family protein [Methylacidiphilales bacterium]|nr:exosortase/archaeosortase family protein [Candidatus Methylacidiphilales bacterium]MDW8349573.1 exosortase/archaeosortase family protein [Verrucomicrobiae bacterium]
MPQNSANPQPSPSPPAETTKKAPADNSLLQNQSYPLLWLAAWWLWAAWACAGDWENTEAYSYGWFVPLFCAYFGWRRWTDRGQQLPTYEPSPQAMLLFLATSAGTVFLVPLIELVRQTPIYWRPLNWLIAGIAFSLTSLYLWAIGGRKLWSIMCFPMLLFFTAVPWPSALEVSLTQSLMLHVAANAAEVLNILGIPAQAQGQIVHLAVGPVGIDEACSGIRSLQTAVMLGFVFGEFFSLKLLARLAFFIAALLITFPINLLRTLTLCLIANYQGLDAINTWHDTVGYVFLGILILSAAALALGISRILGRENPVSPPTGATSVPPQLKEWITTLSSSPFSKIQKIKPLLATASILFGLSHLWYLVHEALYPGFQQPYYALRETSNVQINELEPESQKILLSDYGKSFRCLVPQNDLPCPMGYHIFWKTSRANGRALTHRPDVCMPGVGWQAKGKVTRERYTIAGKEIDWYVFNFFHPASGQHALMFWGLLTDNENIDIDFNRFVYLQRELITTFIRKAQRRFSVEVLALSLPVDSTTQRPDRKTIESLLNQYFTTASQATTASKQS